MNYKDKSDIYGNDRQNTTVLMSKDVPSSTPKAYSPVKRYGRHNSSRDEGGSRVELHGSQNDSSADVHGDYFFGPIPVSKLTFAALKSMGFEQPTSVQEQTVPVMLGGQDLVAQAQTGTGKTAAFGLLLAEALSPSQESVQAFVLTPTRELAVQVSNELRRLCLYCNYRVVTVYGGQPIQRQIDALRGSVQIVVGTPGRMLDHLARRTLSLDRVRIAVLDEADEMLDIGFADDIEKILRFTPASRQTVLFSATIPARIRGMVYRHLKKPVWVRLGREAEPVEQVRQIYYEIDSRDKNAGLEELLQGTLPMNSESNSASGQTLIFRRTQVGVEKLVAYLRQKGYPVRGIHGGMNQNQRDAVMKDFRSGRLKLLVATNVAARGLDIPAIHQVINFDVPQNIEEYVHRIGRTSRMGRPGTAITFVGEWDLDAFDVIQRHVGNDIESGQLALYS